MIDLIKAHKGLATSFVGTIIAVLVLGYLTIVKQSEASDYQLQLTEQVDKLTEINEKEFSVDTKALELAKKNRKVVAQEYGEVMKELSVYSIPLIKMTATRFKAKLQDELISIRSKINAAGIEVNESKMPSLSVKDLTAKKESAYIEADFTKGSQKIAIINALADVLVKAKISKIDFLSWHETEEEKSFVSTLDFELTVAGSQESIESVVSDISSDKKVLFFVKSIECQNLTVLAKTVVSKGKEVDLSSKESRELKIDNQLTCKLYVKVLQFNTTESK